MRYHVVPFTGYPIASSGRQGGRKPVTDWHVVDERGRTVRVFPVIRRAGSKGVKMAERGVLARERLANEYAERLTRERAV